jgi:hypothetical protein
MDTLEMLFYIMVLAMFGLVSISLVNLLNENKMTPCGGCGNPYLDINHLPFKEEQCLKAGGAIIIATYDKRTENCIVSGAANVTKIS